MDLPPSTVLLIVLIAAVANVVVLLSVYARHRAGRGRQLADVGGFMSSSFAADGDDDPLPIAGGWLPPDDASEGWPASRGAGSIGYSTGSWPTASSAPVDDPAGEPFEYPEPTSLEQRAVVADDATDGSDEDDGEDDADWDDEDPDEHVEAEADADADFDDTDAAEGDDPDMEAIPTMNDQTQETESETAPLSIVASGPRGRDTLTGMLDASAFEEVMAQEDAREQRYGRPATVIVFELDGLAKLVDRLGPEPGDRIETALGDTIKRLARRADHVARLERGRYAVLLPETDEVAAINYVERIRRACDLWLESGAIAMRLAIGWASTNGDAGLNGAIRVATDRMRSEMRRNARGVGDETPDLELIETDGPAEAAAGL
jgi:diguanylate cyclase (GGDEF)-like protein